MTDQASEKGHILPLFCFSLVLIQPGVKPAEVTVYLATKGLAIQARLQSKKFPLKTAASVNSTGP
ncbi:hypothetical protein ACFP4H_15025 [Pseudophaeobacter arcticus]|uniref:hypothetical protein n=1 Tax=Pseudophaeobacter arcticus TaxID=385492 RepID=UPI0012B50C24|nr:hypothetical protein [Pseudophaeobacter arcticus]